MSTRMRLQGVQLLYSCFKHGASLLPLPLAMLASLSSRSLDALRRLSKDQTGDRLGRMMWREGCLRAATLATPSFTFSLSSASLTHAVVASRFV